jgi:hypothetical protein
LPPTCSARGRLSRAARLRVSAGGSGTAKGSGDIVGKSLQLAAAARDALDVESAEQTAAI